MMNSCNGLNTYDMLMRDPQKPICQANDLYWLFTEGTTTVTLRLPDGTRKEYEIGPYDLIATPEGVEHGHIPKETVKGLQFVSKIRPGARQGHLYR